MDATIEVSGLRKRFGPTVALDGLSFTVRPGQVTGLVGPNGAGKSTTMRVVLGLDAADDGHALVGGQPYRRLRRPLRHVGALLDAAAVQPSRTARDHLRWLAHSQGLGARRRAGGFSVGMRQRLGIGPGTLTVAGLAAEAVVALLGRRAVPFSEVSAHRATLEEAYLELTRDAAEFRAAAKGAPGRSPG
jgi:ABC-type multidrug transport system ATPase subunit